MSEREYLEEEDLPGLDIPHGWVVGRDDEGRIYMEEDDSGGSPGSWPIDDEESGEDEADDVPSDAGGVDDRRSRRIGPRMRAIHDYVAANPGASVTEVLYATHLSPNLRWIDHPIHRDAIYRAERAGLIVIDRRQSNRYRIYDAELVDLEARREAARDEYWRPTAHP